VTEKEFHALEYIMRPLDLYQRAYMRTHIIDNLLKSGIEVTVVGAGWNEYNGEGKEHLHILSSSGIDIDQTIKLMGDSKIVINNTNIMDGLHERILSAMLAQSVCVTNSYNLLNNFFQNNRDFITYSLDELELLPNIISAILADSQKSEQIAKNGYQAALKSHTWVHRGEQIVSWALNHHPFTY
ncbi:MAG: glycosyltransferase, partial [Thermoflexaceae bacterium]|nr:glycosyltransferase [Thermoflexaceae bacterium]